MTAFERFLLDKGYLKYVLNCKNMKFEYTDKHEISTMVNLDHRYFHSTDTNVLNKIAAGKSVKEKDFTWEDRKGEICFGLNEQGKPATLVSPRPQIRITRTKNGETELISQTSDDAMNHVLQCEDFEKILKAMYDKTIMFVYDLTDKPDTFVAFDDHLRL